MPQPPLSDAILRQTADAFLAHGRNLCATARALGQGRGMTEGRIREARRRGFIPEPEAVTVPPYRAPETTSLVAPVSASAGPRDASVAVLGARGAKPSESIDISGDTCEITKTTARRVKTLADLIAVCEIDTDTWDVERYVCNKWEVGMKPPAVTEYVETKDGRTVPTFVRHASEPVVEALYQVKAWLKRKVAIIAARDEIAALIADAKERIEPSRSTLSAVPDIAGNLLEISIPDLHVGKLAWADETGWEHYDTQIAERLHDEALDALVRRTSCYRFDRVLLVVGNDLLHSDSKQGATTAGTLLDMDSRFQKSFSVARRMIVRAIDMLRGIAPVHVLMVSGNHDTLSVWHMGDSLECYYHEAGDVVIDNAPTMRKYFQFGRVMLMFTHGNKGKLADYPLVMAAEQPEMFGATAFREAHTGDKHQLRVQEYHGVRVRISPALCPPDAWHAEHQFVGASRSAEAFVWNKDEGLIGTAIYTVTPPATPTKNVRRRSRSSAA